MVNRKTQRIIGILVVILFLSFLAAVLIPVYRGSLPVPKQTRSLSNLRQLGFAALMYTNDADDHFAPVGYFDPTAPIGWCGGKGTSGCIRTWSELVVPYSQDTDLFVDPLAPSGSSNTDPNDVADSQAYYPQFGYDFEVLSPVLGLGKTRPLSSSAFGRPGSVPMMTSKATAWVEAPDFWDGGHNLDSSFVIGAPYCNSADGKVDNLALKLPTPIAPVSMCAYVLPGGGNSWGYGSNPGVAAKAGGDTGLVSLRNRGLAAVCFVDGHAQFMSAAQLAVGTNYRANDPTFRPSDLVITDVNTYLWDSN